jgi:type VI secretion system protein ImpC
MSKPWSLRIGGITLGSGSTEPGEARSDAPFLIAILGNFSGRRESETPRSMARPPVRVDRDNFDEVLARFGVEVHLPPGTGSPTGASIRIRELDDFHPDRLFQTLGIFSYLKEVRNRLGNPSTFAAAADEVRGWSASPGLPKRTEPLQQTTPEPSGVSPEQLLEQILGGPLPTEPKSGPKPASGPPGLAEFLRATVEPHLVSDANPDQAKLIARVDAAISATMRNVLHHPSFQETEAAWRAVFFLVSRLETDPTLQLYLLDVSRAELASDLQAEDFSTTSTCKLLLEQQVGTAAGRPWALLVGNYTFELTEADAGLLARLALVARHAGAPFLAAGHGRLLGCPSLAEHPDPRDWHEPDDPAAAKAWATLRRLPEASYLGLTLPRFLLRLPYGRETTPVEQFAFEEMPDASRHDWYLWGNPAFACATLLGESYRQQGWEMQPGDIREIDNLPLHVYQDDGESRLKPPAEVILSERGVEIILDKGLMPLLSLPGQDVIRLVRFQSLAEPLAPLAGKWK